MTNSNETRSTLRSNVRAVKRVEVVVAIAVLIIAAVLLAPVVRKQREPHIHASVINNMKQIALAASGLAFDGVSTGDPNLGWPGDLARNTDSPVVSVSQYIHRLIEHDKMRALDVGKIMHTPSRPRWDGTSRFDGDKHCPYKIYRVTEDNPGETLLLATRNFTYGKGVDASGPPYGDKGFAVIRKGGDGSAHLSKDASKPQRIGMLPSRKSLDDRPVETPEDTLLQK